MAAELFQLKEYARAIDACKKAIAVKEDDVHAWLTLAACYFQLNEDGKALFCFQKAEKLGSLKAKRFLQNASKLDDKLLQAKPVDVLAEVSKEKNKKPEKIKEVPLPAEILTQNTGNHEKFIQDLAGYLLQIGNRLQKDTGGVISFLELFSRLQEDVPGFRGTPADVLEALGYLETNNMIVGVKKLEDTNFSVVEFVPVDFTPDVQDVLKIASESGKLTADEVAKATSWDEFRIKRALVVLENKGIARKVTSYKDGTRWYFPGLNLKYMNEKK